MFARQLIRLGPREFREPVVDPISQASVRLGPGRLGRL